MNTISFRQRVLNVVREIPVGETKTYKEVAMLAGNAHGARAVGSILRTNFDPNIPCHRVIHSDGKPGGYNRGKALKIKKLREEAKRRKS